MNWLFYVRFSNYNQNTIRKDRMQANSVRISNMTKIEPPGVRLRSFRMERGLSGQALADALDATKSTISYWEASKTALPWTACLALQAVYGVSASWLSKGQGPMWIVPGKRKARATNDVRHIAFLDENLGFGPKGEPIEPHPDTPTLDIPTALLLEVVGDTPPEPGSLYLWRVCEDDMAPLLPRGTWALVDVSPPARDVQVENAVYLIRLGHGRTPCLRRLATEPISGDLMIAADAPGRVPLRTSQAARKKECTVLGRAIWAGIHLA